MDHTTPAPQPRGTPDRSEPAGEHGTRSLSAETMSVLDALADAAIVADRNDRIVHVNPAGERMLGWQAAELHGRSLTTLMPSRHHAAHREGFRRYVETGVGALVGRTVRVAARHRGGEEIQIELALSDLSGGFLLGMLRDVRDRVELERQVKEEQRAQAARAQSEAEQRLLAEASELLLGSLDYRNTLAMVAQRLVPAFADWCAIELIDWPDRGGAAAWHEVAQVYVDPDKLELVRGLRRRAKRLPEFGSGKVLRTGAPELLTSVSDEVLAASAPDQAGLELLRSLRLRSAIVAPLKTRGQLIGMLTLISVGDGRRFERADLAFATELAHRMALAIENARLYQQTQEAVKVRDEFLSIASHELRTPLTPLQLQLQLLERTLEDSALQVPLPPRVGTACHRARKQVDRLILLVENLLDVSRIQTGHLLLNLERVELVELVRDVVGRFSEDASRSGSTIEIRAEAHTVGTWDRLRIEQVIVNLLSNALKYGCSEPIAIEIEARPTTAILRIIDRGIGIAPDHLERIFGRFERAVSAQAYGGLGLGLYIVQEIVRAHGGSVRAESARDAGTTFVVELPRNQSPLASTSLR